MRRKLLIGILWVALSFFILGCSTSGEKNITNNVREKNLEEKKHKDEDEYIDKIS